MKRIHIMIFLILSPLLIRAEEEKRQLRKKSEWYAHFDQRLDDLESRLIVDMEAMQQSQVVVTEEMHRLNDKLENRFDKYFLWGYGTLLVIISTLVSVIFNKQRSTYTSKDLGQEKK